jgi:hypothetical protein
MWELWLIIAVTVAALVVVFGALFIGKKQKSMSPIFSLAIVLVVLGIAFGDDPLIRYSFLGMSMTLSVIYAIKSSRKKRIN